MKKIILLFPLVFLQFMAVSQAQEIKLMVYNLLNFPDGRNDCGAGNVNPLNRTDTLRKIVGYEKPDILVACEIQTKAGADSVLSRSLNVFGQTSYQMAPFQPSGGGNGSLNNAMYYNSNKLVFLRQNAISTGVRDINHYTLHAIDPNLSVHRDTIFFEVYMSHLKAGSGSADQATRAEQTAIFRNYVDARPLGRNHFFCGDLNVYRSTEAAYQNLISGGTKPFFDPIATPGSWNNNSSFAAVHTQSPRTSGSIACGSTGGLDDRFDQILVTSNVLSGSDRLVYETNSYTAVGNDGQHFNSNILAAPVNLNYPDSVILALYNMSDHLPVTMKISVNLPTSNGLALTYSNNGPICFGQNVGQATVIPLLGQAPYTFLWDMNANNQTTATATNLLAGNYCVFVTDATGLTDTVCFEIQGVQGVTANIFPTGATNLSCNGEATAIISGGIPTYTFLWNDPLAQANQTAINLCPGNYTCTITDQSGCSVAVSTVILGELSVLDNLITNHELVVAPNPIGNELTLQNLSNTMVKMDKVMLVNTQGKLIFEIDQVSILPNSSTSWPFENLPNGIYFLKLKVENNGRFIKVIK